MISEDMTISQGRILIKLIDRETQNTSYTLIREYRGKFSVLLSGRGLPAFSGLTLKKNMIRTGKMH